jgi:3-deoxy-D-manno-octulosonic-acid transferase
MTKQIYNLILLLIFPLILPYLLSRTVIGKESFNSVKRKMGFYGTGKIPSGCVWVHAVSVGETKTAVPLVETLRREYPKKKILFTVSTATGMAVAEKEFKKIAEKGGEDVTLDYFPYDLPFAVNSALKKYGPSLFIFLETELWPNFLTACKKTGVKTVLVNGRISDHSFGRYKKWRSLFAPVLAEIDAILMQTDEDLKRIITLGADPEHVKVAGNLKFDRSLQKPCTGEEVRDKFSIGHDIPVIIFASTHPGEDELLLKTLIELRREFPLLVGIIAPRHPERAGEILGIAARLGIATAVRTKRDKPEELLVLDTVGELGLLYGGTDIAVMGGSFIPHGGQNPLEPAEWKVPVIFGPHMENFRSITELLLESGGAFQVANREELKKIALKLLSDPPGCRKAGTAVYKTILSNRGALKNTILEIMNIAGREE